MAIGDKDNMLSRLGSLIPRGWFASAATLRNAVLGGLGDAMAWVFDQTAKVRLQARLKTTSGYFLDLAAYDFVGTVIRRKSGEPDASFRTRLLAEIFRERVTRKGMIQALTDLTGRTPVIFEPWNTGDAAAIGFTFAVGVGFPVGEMALESQTFVTAYRPGNAGIAYIAGIGTNEAAIGGGRLTPVVTNAQSGITDQDIYDAINRTKPTGSIVWTKLV